MIQKLSKDRMWLNFSQLNCKGFQLLVTVFVPDTQTNKEKQNRI